MGGRETAEGGPGSRMRHPHRGGGGPGRQRASASLQVECQVFFLKKRLGFVHGSMT
jgi:hypothetical protein